MKTIPSNYVAKIISGSMFSLLVVNETTEIFHVGTITNTVLIVYNKNEAFPFGTSFSFPFPGGTKTITVNGSGSVGAFELVLVGGINNISSGGSVQATIANYSMLGNLEENPMFGYRSPTGCTILHDNKPFKVKWSMNYVYYESKFDRDIFFQLKSELGLTPTLNDGLENMPRGSIYDPLNNRLITSFEKFQGTSSSDISTMVDGKHIINVIEPVAINSSSMYYIIEDQGDPGVGKVFYAEHFDYSNPLFPSSSPKLLYKNTSGRYVIQSLSDRMFRLTDGVIDYSLQTDIDVDYTKYPTYDAPGVYNAFRDHNSDIALSIPGMKKDGVRLDTGVLVRVVSARDGLRSITFVDEFSNTSNVDSPVIKPIGGSVGFGIQTNSPLFQKSVYEGDLLFISDILDITILPRSHVLNFHNRGLSNQFLYGITDIDDNIDILDPLEHYKLITTGTKSQVSLPFDNMHLLESYYEPVNNRVRLIASVGEEQIILMDENFVQIGYYAPVAFKVNDRTIALLDNEGTIALRGYGETVIRTPLTY